MDADGSLDDIRVSYDEGYGGHPMKVYVHRRSPAG
jgi:hypothetical protein